MEVKINIQDNIATIAVKGSIDSKTSGEFSTQIMDRISSTDHVLLDFSDVDFVSSAGLRVLLMIYRQIKSKNGKVVLVGLLDEIKDVMSMTGFINFFEIADSVDVALKNYFSNERV
ncbi:MAG: STAS domain-containing protein [Dysgonamonadaceae bacterium]|jgi:anti-sigma B factor antagonist|nr:STAS domain-containing protein [Dysgonamonadaceae bacterium]